MLDENTPTYGNRNQFVVEKKSAIAKGDIANDSFIFTTVHIGTHIDMPYHFYQDGQTIEDFDANFWIFDKILFLDIKPNGLIINNEIVNKLKDIQDIGYEILIVKTGICHARESENFWSENFGFSPDVYNYLVANFSNIRVFGFDSVSVSSFSNRMLGREAHKRFLNPSQPILLLEDMDLRYVDENTEFNKIIIAPLRISNCDGLLCTVFGVTS